MTRCFTLSSALAALLCAATYAHSETIQVTADLVCTYGCDPSTPPGDYATLILTFDATGLPVAVTSPGISVSDLTASLDFDSGFDVSAAGSGSVTPYDPDANVLNFSVGPLRGGLLFPLSWAGDGPILAYDSEGNESFVLYGTDGFNVNGGSSTTVTPEPSSLSLLALSLISVGGGHLVRLRRRTSLH